MVKDTDQPLRGPLTGCASVPAPLKSSDDAPKPMCATWCSGVLECCDHSHCSRCEACIALSLSFSHSSCTTHKDVKRGVASFAGHSATVRVSFRRTNDTVATVWSHSGNLLHTLHPVPVKGQASTNIDAASVGMTTQALVSASGWMAARRGTAQYLLKFVMPGSLVAVGMQYGPGTSYNLRWPPVYGHIWAHQYSFWKEFVEPRLLVAQTQQDDSSVNALAWVTIVLPAGIARFDEIAELWSSNVTRLRIETRPWVPICILGCCWSQSAPPASEQSRALLLADFPPPSVAYDGNSHMWRWRDFRRDAWRSLGVNETSWTTGRDHMRRPGGKWGLFVWVVAGSGSNQRRIAHETAVIATARQVVSAVHPDWRFETLDARRMSYTEELRLYAHADAVVSLFGSAMHHCRFMRNGSLLVEIHGAMRSDTGADYFYQRICTGPLGVRWLGYATVGYHPPPLDNNGSQIVMNTSKSYQAIYTSNYSFSVAHIDTKDFCIFLTQALKGRHKELVAKYDAVMRDVRSRPTGILPRGPAPNARKLISA